MPVTRPAGPWNALAPAAAYFAIAFGAGFVLGTLRVLVIVPRIGERFAELAEMPVMFGVIFWAAGFVVRRFAPWRSRAALAWTGGMALALLVCAELLLSVVVQDRGLGEYLASRDPVSGSVYLLTLVVFAGLPAWRGHRLRQ